MKDKNNITLFFKSLVFATTIAILLPSIVKAAHIFNHHEHKVCNNDYGIHFHELDVDCEFYKYKLNTNYHFVPAQFQSLVKDNFTSNDTISYSFIKSNNKLVFLLRGPPLA